MSSSKSGAEGLWNMGGDYCDPLPSHPKPRHPGGRWVGALGWRSALLSQPLFATAKFMNASLGTGSCQQHAGVSWLPADMESTAACACVSVWRLIGIACVL